MADNKDKIKQEILDELRYGTGRPLGMSESEWKKFKKEKELIQRQASLQYLKEYKRETLAQRVELEKLKFQNSKVAGKIGEYASPVAGIVGGVTSGVSSAGIASGKAIANSKAGKSILQAIMYSNPITALIAENSDLLKGLGKAGLGLGKAGLAVGKGIGKLGLNLASDAYSLIRGKGLPFNKQQSTGQQMLSARGGSNYILSKSAVFIGGKNYIISGGKSFDAGSFSNGNLKDKLGLPGSKTLLLEDKQNKETKKISQGVKGLVESSKQTNKFLDIIKTKYMLIGGLVLAGVVGILALTAWLKNKFGSIVKNSTPNINHIKQAQAFEAQSNNTVQGMQNKLNQSANNASHISEFTNLKRAVSKGGKSLEFGTGGWQAQSKEGDPYPAPYDLKILEIEENNKKLGSVNIIAERMDTLRRNNITLMNIVNPLVVPVHYDTSKDKRYSHVKKGTIIGFVGPGGKIQIKDISKNDFQSYIGGINKGIEDGVYGNNQSIDQDRVDLVNKYMSDMGMAKRELNYSTVDSNSIAYAKQQKSIDVNRNKLAIQTLEDAIASDSNGTMINGRFIPKSQLRSELNKYNKNVTNALSQSEKAIPNKHGVTTGQAASIDYNAILNAPVLNNDTPSQRSYEVADPESIIQQSSMTINFK